MKEGKEGFNSPLPLSAPFRFRTPLYAADENDPWRKRGIELGVHDSIFRISRLSRRIERNRSRRDFFARSIFFLYLWNTRFYKGIISRTRARNPLSKPREIYLFGSRDIVFISKTLSLSLSFIRVKDNKKRRIRELGEFESLLPLLKSKLKMSV